jgi:UDP-N-acetylmuramate: L-alanyl-gamma-D-glutamyl-meso-diaminopimelate ligase
MHLHILGICGTLMGSLALLAKELGFTVSGSDQNVYPPMSTLLESQDIEVNEGYLPEHLKPDPDLVLIGNAGLPRGNAAVEYVLARGFDYISGAEWLGRYVLKDRWVIAAAGTHGKTTSASMLAWILEYAGLQPGFLIGGVPGNFDVSARLGDAPFFVVEADEYDTSYFDRRAKFLHYRPRTLVLNNLEYDHADIFPDLRAIQQQFHLLLRAIPANGLIVRPARDDNLDEVLKQGCWTPVETFGISEEDALWSAADADSGFSEFAVHLSGKHQGTVQWQLLGKHNAHNALAAIAAARHSGVKAALAIEALHQFKGVKRRMELIADVWATKVYDDFAHHPTAIQTTLNGLRAKVGKEEIIAIIEPASHTMRKGIHRQTLPDACLDADRVIWYKPDNVQWDMSSLVKPGDETVQVMDRTEQIIDKVVEKLHKRDRPQHIVIMSNGGFRGIHKELVKRLRNS